MALLSWDCDDIWGHRGPVLWVDSGKVEGVRALRVQQFQRRATSRLYTHDAHTEFADDNLSTICCPPFHHDLCPVNYILRGGTLHHVASWLPIARSQGLASQLHRQPPA